jgi:hypothetical protein
MEPSVANGGNPIAVAGAGVVALPAAAAGTTNSILTNPVAVRIAYGVVASDTVGTYYPAYACPVFETAEQRAAASVYWTAAATGAYIQDWK